MTILSMLLAATGIGVGHAILPDHWMPLALLARTRRYPLGRVARLALAAAVTHVVVSVLFGVALAAVGLRFRETVARHTDVAVGGVLVATGVALALLEVLGRGHQHAHSETGCGHTPLHEEPTAEPHLPAQTARRAGHSVAALERPAAAAADSPLEPHRHHSLLALTAAPPDCGPEALTPPAAAADCPPEALTPPAAPADCAPEAHGRRSSGLLALPAGPAVVAGPALEAPASRRNLLALSAAPADCGPEALTPPAAPADCVLEAPASRRNLLTLLAPFSAAASPDLTILPFFLTAGALGIAPALGVLAAFALATIAVMVGLTMAAATGASRLTAPWIEQRATLLTAVTLLLIGVLVISGIL